MNRLRLPAGEHISSGRGIALRTDADGLDVSLWLGDTFQYHGCQNPDGTPHLSLYLTPAQVQQLRATTRLEVATAFGTLTLYTQEPM